MVYYGRQGIGNFHDGDGVEDIEVVEIIFKMIPHPSDYVFFFYIQYFIFNLPC